ncbi:MAG TPA: protein kinase [Candidatus Polarisedimenticolia bacterium]|nr:protein kinase [Candidatus Polarisedimenticolia bacterium]
MKDLLREARKAARQGDLSRAGDLCDMAGHPLDAIAYYVEGRHYLLAGQVAARIGEYAQAAGYFSSGGDGAQAAEMYIKAGQKKKASMMYERSGLYLKAAELEEKMTNFQAAGALYEMGGQPEKAAYLFAQAGDTLRAAELYEKLLGSDSRPPAIDSGAFNFEETRRRRSRHARFAGILYLKAGQAARAGPFLEEAGLFDQAVLAYRKAGRTDRAAGLLIKLENYAEALRLVEEDPDARVEPKLLGELYLRSGRFDKAAEVFLAQGLSFKAAECFESGGDLARAAALFSSEGEHVRSADLYSGIGRHREAAEAYEKAHELLNAGRAYEKAGEPEQASRVFLKAGKPLEASRIYIRKKDTHQAIRILQQVRKEDPDYPQVCFALGKLFSEQGLYTPAAEKFEIALKGARQEEEKTRSLYHLALTYEQMGRVEDACRLYEKVLSVDYHHADVAERVKALARQVSQAGAATTGQRTAGAQPPPSSAATPQGIAANISGRLEVTRKLGQGRYAIVFEAYDRVLQKKVAAKRYPPAASATPDMIHRFLREARKASDLAHPAHVMVLATGEDREGRYIIEELVEGRTLREMLDEKIRLEPARVMEMASQICDVLSHAHRKGLLHRDLRPENIFVMAQDQVKVSDFGLKARQTDPAALEGRAACYVPPEILKGERVDERSDVYALGIVLYEMLMGEPPFPPDTASFDHLNLPPPFPVKVDRILPAFLKRIIERCLEKDRARRYKSAAQVLDDLKASGIVPGVVIADRYEIVRELGVGGMGRIYQALDRELDEPVALKVLRGAGDGDGRQVERFLREIKMARRIAHPNVVKVYDLGSWKDHRYITMEYIDGVNLEQWVRLRPGLDIPATVRLMADVARGIASAHAVGIIHRDVKPQNILLQDQRVPKILDFGIARGKGDNDVTTAGFVMGSPKYMSPEQVQAMPLDARTDVYSLGVVLYFVFTGREPFVGDTPSVIAYRHIGEPPRPPRELDPTIPSWLDELILKALAKDREQRHSSMNELADALEAGLRAAAAAGR